ncbi:MAG: hypothetical protein AAF321_01835 [Pseudomonadota bacterium]
MRAVPAVLAATMLLPSIALADPLPAARVIATEAAPAERSTARPDIPCTCRYKGRDIGLGDAICMNGRMARCEMVLNNTSWAFSEEPCPLVSLAPAGWSATVAPKG